MSGLIFDVAVQANSLALLATRLNLTEKKGWEWSRNVTHVQNQAVGLSSLET
jgi:hypothetical protein